MSCDLRSAKEWARDLAEMLDMVAEDPGHPRVEDRLRHTQLTYKHAVAAGQALGVAGDEFRAMMGTLLGRGADLNHRSLDRFDIAATRTGDALRDYAADLADTARQCADVL